MVKKGFIKKTSIKEQVYEIVKERILTRSYSFGTKININALVSEFQVSNTPVREALSMLQNEGLLTFSSNMGYEVFTPTEEDIRAMEDTMTILMIGGYELFRFRNETDQLADILEERLVAQERAIEKGSLLDKSYAAAEFDSTLFSVAQTPAIHSLYQTLISKMIMLSSHDYQSGKLDPKDSLREHKRILDAVRAGDSKMVDKLLAEHFIDRLKL
jgi:DNA-binding GntR family transcriptional regulator